MEKLMTFLRACNDNRRIVGFWAVTFVLIAGVYWFFFTGNTPESANADEAGGQASAQPAENNQGAAPAQPAPPANTMTIAPAKPRVTLAKPAAKSGAVDEYQYMAQMFNLQGEALEKFEQACARREAVLQFWTDGPGKKVEELRKQMKDAKAAKDEKTVAEIKELHDVLNQMDIDMRTELRAAVMAELTLEQQRRWGGFVLNREVLRRLARIELSEKQKEYVKRLADDQADRMVKQDTIEKDPFLQNFKGDEVINPLLKQVRDKILTIDQRARIPEPGKAAGGNSVTVKQPGLIR
jgi:hypothetical protein